MIAQGTACVELRSLASVFAMLGLGERLVSRRCALENQNAPVMEFAETASVHACLRGQERIARPDHAPTAAPIMVSATSTQESASVTEAGVATIVAQHCATTIAMAFRTVSV